MPQHHCKELLLHHQKRIYKRFLKSKHQWRLLKSKSRWRCKNKLLQLFSNKLLLLFKNRLPSLFNKLPHLLQNKLRQPTFVSKLRQPLLRNKFPQLLLKSKHQYSLLKNKPRQLSHKSSRSKSLWQHDLKQLMKFPKSSTRFQLLTVRLILLNYRTLH